MCPLLFHALLGAAQGILTDWLQGVFAPLLQARTMTQMRRSAQEPSWGLERVPGVRTGQEEEVESTPGGPQGRLSKLRGQGGCCVSFLRQEPQIMADQNLPLS